MDETILPAFMCVLVAFIVVLIVLGVTLIVFLRVILSALSQGSTEAWNEEAQKQATEQDTASIGAPLEQENEIVETEDTSNANEETEVAAAEDKEIPESEQDLLPTAASDELDEDERAFIMEKNERVRYDRSCEAKLRQLKNDAKEWYTDLKNELLSYEKIKSRLSWRYETFRTGKNNVARFMVRGKTLCLLLAAEPSIYADTKYTVEDVSSNVTTADTPTLYRIKSNKRVKYAKDMIADVMRRIHVFINPRYIAKDYFLPYEGDMALMQRGLVKRVVNNSTRKYRIEEINGEENTCTEAPKFT